MSLFRLPAPQTTWNDAVAAKRVYAMAHGNGLLIVLSALVRAALVIEAMSGRFYLSSPLRKMPPCRCSRCSRIAASGWSSVSSQCVPEVPACVHRLTTLQHRERHQQQQWHQLQQLRPLLVGLVMSAAAERAGADSMTEVSNVI